MAMTSAVDTRCIACLSETHDHDANGVCPRCRIINRNTYEELIGLLVANDVHIETKEVLGTGERV